MNLQSKLQESYNEVIEKLEAKRNDTDWLPEFPDGYQYDIFPLATSGIIRVSAPFDRRLIKMIEQNFTDDGWSISLQKSEMDCGDWYPYFCFYKHGEDGTLRSLEVVFFDWNPGSVCHRKVIGTRTVEKEEAIYEFSCD